MFPADASSIDLRHNTNLRFLRLPESPGSYVLPTESILDMVSTISSTTISEMWISLGWLTEQQWKRFDEMFARDPRFLNLQKLVVGFPGMRKPPKVMLPWTRERVEVEVRMLPV
jgi:hypothetical protein